jgi:AcrR family transcriptional regulator
MRHGPGSNWPSPSLDTESFNDTQVMPEKKRPRRTRERILETSLGLFNRHGAPHVTTADIAGEMNISPGNLYYYFGNKDEIIGELYSTFEERLRLLLADPRGRKINVEDLWLWLHLFFELMAEYRFLYRDLDELASRDRTVGVRFARLLRQGVGTVVELCRAMVEARAMVAADRDIAALAQNVMLVATYWPSFARIGRLPPEGANETDAGRAAYQVLALIAPYLVGDARALIDRLGRDYL